jgi:hypothetical protein
MILDSSAANEGEKVNCLPKFFAAVGEIREWKLENGLRM